MPHSFSIGESVFVPVPEDNDIWMDEFAGTIVMFKGDDLAVVEDQDGDCWDVELYRLGIDF